MLNLRSSQSASTASCSLRQSVRSCVRNRFLASCWVIVEPPCDTPRRSTLATAARTSPIGIDAEVAVEAAVLDRDEGLRQVGRQFLERDSRAVHLAAGRERLAIDARRFRSVGGRFGISSDWIGGKLTVTQAMTPAKPIKAHSPSTRLQ